VSADDTLALRDAHDIFGMDLEELDDMAFGMDSEEEENYEEGRGMSAASRSLRKFVEPAVLEANMVTDEADFIRSMPLPERLHHLLSVRRESGSE
jgi:hypothetical protein